MTASAYRSFQDFDALYRWLEQHHDREEELWVQIFKKATGVASVDWNDCVLAALAWGWIDSQKRALDERSYIQRLTPRRANSNWSERNQANVESLIATGKMQPSGMAHVLAAKRDGRWSTTSES